MKNFLDKPGALVYRATNEKDGFFNEQTDERKQQFFWLLVLLRCVGLPVAGKDLVR
jgi:hypothetical protein